MSGGNEEMLGIGSTGTFSGLAFAIGNSTGVITISGKGVTSSRLRVKGARLRGSVRHGLFRNSTLIVLETNSGPKGVRLSMTKRGVGTGGLILGAGWV